MKSQLYTFQDGDTTITVRTEEQPNGEYTAVDNDCGAVVGWGFSTIGAIADLFSRIPRAESDREEYDRNAARFDRAQDHRKHDIRF